MIRQNIIKSTLLLGCLLSAPPAGLAYPVLCNQLQNGGSIEGTVIDAQNGIPVYQVEVILIRGDSTRIVMMTDPNGRFIRDGLEPDIYDLMVSVVGYGLIKKRIEVKAGDPLRIEILLSPGTQLDYEMTVTAESNPLASSITLSEIDKMKTVLMDDAVRALQLAPEVAASDDFNTGFAFQGSGFENIGMLFDGIPVYSFQHSTEGIENTGSTSILSANLIQGLSLVPAGSSGDWSGSSAGYLTLTSRTGNRDRLRGLASISGSAALFSAEGPAGNGSWIVSARKSYIDWIVRRIDKNTTLNFGFYDFFGKIGQTVNERHQISFSALYGNTGLNDATEGTGMNSIDRGRLKTGIAHVSWDWNLTARVNSTTHFSYQSTESTNRNPNNDPLWNNHQSIFGIRSVWNFQIAERWYLNSGANLERWRVENRQDFFDPSTNEWILFQQFEDTTSRQQVFLETSYFLHESLNLKAGWNWSHQNKYGGNFHSPYLGFDLRIRDHNTLSFSFGKNGQFPFFNQVLGRLGNRQLRPESAKSLQASWLYFVPGILDLKVSGYYRTRSSVPWREDGWWRLVDDEVTPPSASVYENLLEDESYGMMARIGRQVATGLSGWFSYAWNYSRWSEKPGLGFPGNYDQPHALAVFGNYRWASDMEFSLKWKFAKGQPIRAYAQLINGKYYLAEERNRLRLRDYNRVDIRFGKSFTKNRYRITLFVEVLNLANWENERFSGHDFDSVNPKTGRIYGLVQSQFPILPTAGMIFEF